jgi:hypothetical protein
VRVLEEFYTEHDPDKVRSNGYIRSNGHIHLCAVKTHTHLRTRTHVHLSALFSNQIGNSAKITHLYIR